MALSSHTSDAAAARVAGVRYSNENRRRSRKYTRAGRCVPVLAAAILLLACSAGVGNRADTAAANEKLAATIKAAMVGDARINGATIDVRVEDDVVVLEGFAETSAARQAAEETARRFIDERSLNVRLTVK